MGVALMLEPQLQQINEIMAYSWITKEHPDAMARFGFRVVDTHPLLGKIRAKYIVANRSNESSTPPEKKGKPGALAVISKKDLLEHYGLTQEEVQKREGDV